MNDMRTAQGLQAALQQSSDPQRIVDLALAGFHTSGRGAILVRAASGDELDLCYVSRGQVVNLLDDGGAGDEAVADVWDKMTRYDPDSSFVAAFLADDDLAFDILKSNTLPTGE